MQMRDIPQHPNVDWEDIQRSAKGRPYVAVTCPHCGERRYYEKGSTLYRLRKGTFNPSCYKDRLLGIHRVDRMERLEHPAVNWNKTKVVQVQWKNGKNKTKHRLTYVCVTCPICKQERYTNPGPIAAQIRKGIFIGRCKQCGVGRSHYSWTVLSPGRFLQSEKGYVVITKEAIPEGQHPLFDAMVSNKKLGRWQTLILEHRFIMALSLGRPLEPYELVDHMDGNKTNNDISNLRLYIRGKNQPGSHSGYGTYYHEWQTALAKIAQLEAELESLKIEGMPSEASPQNNCLDLSLLYS